MKRFLTLLLMLTLVVGVASVTSAEELSFKERAENTYSNLLKRVVLDVSKNDTLTTTKYNSIYVPVKDLFKSTGATITWDSKNKITSVQKQGTELILNFSGKEITAGKNQVVLPQEWVQLEKGVSGIHACVLAYIYESGADDTDQERLEWQEKLNFLNIEQTSGIAGVDRYMHVGVVFKD